MEKQYNRDVQIIHDFDGVSIDIMNSNEWNKFKRVSEKNLKIK